MVTGGPFTRLDPATGNKSCLDLFIVSKELLPYVGKLEIDSERKLGIARVEKSKKKGKPRLVYTDHFPLLLTLENLPLAKEERKEKVVKWNLAKEGGWLEYKEESHNSTERLIDIVLNKEYSIDETKKRFDKVHEHIKYKAFGKVTLRQNHKEKGKKESKGNDKKEKEEDKANKQWEEEVKRAEEEIKEIDKLRNGKVGKIWEVKKRIIGGKKATMQATAVINPETGKLSVSKEETIKATLKYCKETLKNNEPENEFKEEIEKKKDIVAKYLEQKDGQFKATKETFINMIEKFKKSRKKNYDYLTKASKGFQDAIFQFCVRMFEEEEFPVDF